MIITADRRAAGLEAFSPWTITTWLIVINVAVFVIDGALDRALTYWGAFSINAALTHLQLWRFITYQFLHASVSHIFFNMLGLYFFGPIVESQLGARRYLAFYLSCGIAGALSFIAMWAAHVLITSPFSIMIGASAGIFGVLLAAARLAPNLTVVLLFPPIPLRLAVLAWGYLAFAAYTVLMRGQNAGGQAAHLGGGLWGFILIRNPHWLDWLMPRRRIGTSPRQRTMFRDWSRDKDH